MSFGNVMYSAWDCLYLAFIFSNHAVNVNLMGTGELFSMMYLFGSAVSPAGTR